MKTVEEHFNVKLIEDYITNDELELAEKLRKEMYSKLVG